MANTMIAVPYAGEKYNDGGKGGPIDKNGPTVFWGRTGSPEIGDGKDRLDCDSHSSLSVLLGGNRGYVNNKQRYGLAVLDPQTPNKYWRVFLKGNEPAKGALVS